MALVGKQAPEFCSKAVVDGKIVDDFSLSEYRGKYVLFFFYPLDFTFVCPTELHAFQERLDEFEQRNAQLIGCSVDSWFSHAAWLGIPKSKGGIKASRIQSFRISIKRSPPTTRYSKWMKGSPIAVSF